MKNWKFSKEALKKRNCELCRKRLSAKEMVICKSCYHESIGKNGTGVKK